MPWLQRARPLGEVTAPSAGSTTAAPARLSEALGSTPAAQLGVSPGCVLSPYLFASSDQIKGDQDTGTMRREGSLSSWRKKNFFGILSKYPNILGY